MLLNCGLTHVALIPQLFAKYSSTGNFKALLAKIVDDMIICGSVNIIEGLISSINANFTLGTIKRGPGCIRYFGLILTQHADHSINVDSDYKFTRIQPFPLSRVRCRQQNETLNPIELSSFLSVSSAIGWIGSTASLLCAEFSSRFQQRTPQATVHDLVLQATALRKLKRQSTTSTIIRPSDNLPHDVSVLVFADVARSVDYSQLCYIVGLLIFELNNTGIYYILSWSSRISRRPGNHLAPRRFWPAAKQSMKAKQFQKLFASCSILKCPSQLWSIRKTCTMRCRPNGMLRTSRFGLI